MKYLFILSVFFSFCLSSVENTELYFMKTAEIIDEKLVFPSHEDFEEALKVGFFRIKTPVDLDLTPGRNFAKSFTSNPRYNQFGILDVVNGYLQSDIAQSVRFSLERENWNKCHVGLVEVEGPPNYSRELQDMANKMADVGMVILKSILREFDIPESLWFEATAGSAYGEGSHFLVFNCYDSKVTDRPYGVGPHKDWGHVAILDAIEPGLEAKIDNEWKALFLEDGYLVVNFGYPFEKLLPGVKASEHRVVKQEKKMRATTILFIDPRVGPYREGVVAEQSEGYVYDWDPVEKKLFNGESTVSFFEKLSQKLFGDQSGKETSN